MSMIGVGIAEIQNLNPVVGEITADVVARTAATPNDHNAKLFVGGNLLFLSARGLGNPEAVRSGNRGGREQRVLDKTTSCIISHDFLIKQ